MSSDLFNLPKSGIESNQGQEQNAFPPDLCHQAISDISNLPRCSPAQPPNLESCDRWMMEPLYRTDKGKRRFWVIYFVKEKESLYIRHGFIGGEIQHNEVKIIPKVKRTLSEQAWQEARNRYNINCREKKYHTDGNADGSGPMLAPKYTVKSIKRWPVYVDMKIDGWRAIVKHIPGSNHHVCVRINTRGGKGYHWLEAQREELRELLGYLPPNTQLDCEVWKPGFSRNKIQEIVSTEKKKHPQNEEIEFYIFDIIETQGLTLSERWEILLNAYKQFCKDRQTDQKEIKYTRLLNKFIARSHKEVIKYHDHFVGTYGAEGAMVKKICSLDTIHKRDSGEELSKAEEKEIAESLYRSRRCNAMFKLKAFEDAEAEIISYDVATGTQKGCIILRMRMPCGKEFGIGSFLGCDLDERKRLAEMGDELIGRQFTYKYQDLSDDGIPLHPVGIGLRDFL